MHFGRTACGKILLPPVLWGQSRWVSFLRPVRNPSPALNALYRGKNLIKIKNLRSHQGNSNPSKKANELKLAKGVYRRGYKARGNYKNEE